MDILGKHSDKCIYSISVNCHFLDKRLLEQIMIQGKSWMSREFSFHPDSTSNVVQTWWPYVFQLHLISKIDLRLYNHLIVLFSEDQIK